MDTKSIDASYYERYCNPSWDPNCVKPCNPENPNCLKKQGPMDTNRAEVNYYENSCSPKDPYCVLPCAPGTPHCGGGTDADSHGN